MRQFLYTVRSPYGLHVRVAGQLAQVAASYRDTAITVAKGDRQADAGRVIRLLGLGVRQGDQVSVTAQGPSEEEAIAALEAFFHREL